MVKIYSHCFAKWKHCLYKLRPALVDFFTTFDEHVEPDIDLKTDGGIVSCINGIDRDVTWIVRHLPNVNYKQQDQQELQKFMGGDKFLGRMHSIMTAVQYLSRNGFNQIDAWARVGRNDAEYGKYYNNYPISFGL